MGAISESIDSVNSWDEYYFKICRAVASNSKCLSRKIGSILVRDKSVISTGYNGPPRGVDTCDNRWYNDIELLNELQKTQDVDQITCPEEFSNLVKDKCPRHVLGLKSGERIDLCPAGHAEENSILNAARLGICTKDTIMYMTCSIPCSKCLVKIINAGVKELVVISYDVYDKTTNYLLRESNIKYRLYDFVKKSFNKS